MVQKIKKSKKLQQQIRAQRKKAKENRGKRKNEIMTEQPKKKAKSQLVAEAAVAEAKAQLAKALIEVQKNLPTDNPPSKRVFVGNLPTDISDEELAKLFKQSGKLIDMYRMMDKKNNKRSFNGKMIIGFKTKKLAALAVSQNGQDYLGRTILVNFVKPKPVAKSLKQKNIDRQERIKPEGCDTIYVGNIPYATDDVEVKSHFKECGIITRIDKVDSKVNQAKGHRAVFIKFAHPDVALPIAMKLKKDATEINGKKLRITYQKRKNLLRPQLAGCDKIFIANVPKAFCNDATIKELFKDCGEIKSLTWKKNKTIGFICFANPDVAHPIAVKLNNTEFHGNTLHISYAGKYTSKQRNSAGKRESEDDMDTSS